MKPATASPAYRRLVVGLLATALLYSGAGCKPAPPAAAAQPLVPPPPAAGSAPTTRSAPLVAADNGNARQPTAEDFQTFFQDLFPAILKVTEVKADPPVRLPNAPSASNAWSLNVKVVLTPAEDLLALPPANCLSE